MTDCLFCNIANGDIPTDFVYEDDRLVAFKDINPKAPHHLLIIPRTHIATLNDFNQVDETLIGQMMLTAKKIAEDLGINERGYRVVMNCNNEGGQEVYHAHLHLLGGERLSWFK